MNVLVTKASSDYWYRVINVETLDDVMKIYPEVIIRKNDYSADDILKFWDGVKDKAEANRMADCKYTVTMYDDYIE